MYSCVFSLKIIKITSKKDFINDYDYYLNQWREIHSMINSKYLKIKNVFLFDFDKFLIDPVKSIQKLSKIIKLDYNDDVSKYIELNIKIKKLKETCIKETEINNLYKSLLEKCIN